MTQTPGLKNQALQVGGIDSGSCAKTIEVGLQQMVGVSEASVSFAAGRLQVSYDPLLLSEITIYDRIQALGFFSSLIPARAAKPKATVVPGSGTEVAGVRVRLIGRPSTVEAG